MDEPTASSFQADGTEPEPCATLGTSGQTELKISAVETLKRLCMNGDVGDSSCRVESARGVKRWSSGGSDAMFLEPFRASGPSVELPSNHLGRRRGAVVYSPTPLLPLSV